MVERNRLNTVPIVKGRSGDLETSIKKSAASESICLRVKCEKRLTCSMFLKVVGVKVDVVRVGTPLIPLIPLLNPPSTNCNKEMKKFY